MLQKIYRLKVNLLNRGRWKSDQWSLMVKTHSHLRGSGSDEAAISPAVSAFIESRRERAERATRKWKPDQQTQERNHGLSQSRSEKHSWITFCVLSRRWKGRSFRIKNWYLRPSSRTKAMKLCKWRTMRPSSVLVVLICGFRFSSIDSTIFSLRLPFSSSYPV